MIQSKPASAILRSSDSVIPRIRGCQPDRAGPDKDRDNFNLDSAHQAGQVRNKERNTEEHREPQTDGEEQGGETPPHKPGPPAWLREGLARALQAGGPERRPRGPLPAKRGGRAVKAPPGRTPAVGARRASATANEEPEAATDVGRQRDVPRPVHTAQGLGGPEVEGSIGQPAIVSANRRAPPPREYILMFADELGKWRRLSAMPTSLHFAVRGNIIKFLSCFKA